ncbi:unnamed protein product [Phytomonas sp. EM1]|nr:unnamed protein product [Phytomonas sp. EM1]|eukprot:CCW63535.1 unnamed protein product [Phytomonas sp. isolate EM1]
MSGVSNSASASPQEKLPDTSIMQTAELRAHIERCERLMRQEALLERLPDRGAGVKHRYSIYTAELERRKNEQELQNGENNAEKEGCGSSVGAPLGVGKVNSPAKVRNEETMPYMDPNYATQLRIIEEKYQDVRIPVEKIVRRMYEGSLSETEIQRILKDIPPKYFLTHRETCERMRELARRAREEELQKLKQQSM